MQLFVHIASNTETVEPILNGLLENGISGATTVDCKGMLRVLNESTSEPPPILGSLRHFLNPEHESRKMILIVLKDEDVPIVKEIIHRICGSLKQPNAGILFTVPVMNWEGVSHK